ncbi:MULTISPECIES: hypothetical protein [Streptomyces]|uniref:hypothetical protein n=1 Tax=Streptomyces TaxID=1883 RepID=UPI00117F39BE|nr:hypothetical protein [Streptomyces kasugaensis]
MAGTMNNECLPHRGLLTELLLLGRPLPKELSRHLVQCPDCTREAAETQDVVRTLRRANPREGWEPAPDSGPQARPSWGLGHRIRREAAGAGTARFRPWRATAVSVIAAAAVAVAVIIPLGAAEQAGRTADAGPVVMVRQGKMVDRPWGTEVPVALSGLAAGETYQVMTVNARGVRIPAGTVRAESGERVSFRMVTAMRKDTITELLAEDESGHVVSRLPVGSSPA